MSILLRAFVVGYTGETGKALVKALAKDQRYSSVKLIGRREVELDYGVDANVDTKKFSQHTVDFDHLEDYQMVFSDTDVGFSALGTTLAKSGKEQMKKIDHDYTVKVAELALQSGVKELHVISSMSANPKSWLFYSRLKGETEEDLKSVGVFPNYLAIYRPGLLICDRTERRLTERITATLLKPVSHFYPTWITVPIETLGLAMANAPFSLASLMRKRAKTAGDSYDPKAFVVDNKLLFELASNAEAVDSHEPK